LLEWFLKENQTKTFQLSFAKIGSLVSKTMSKLDISIFYFLDEPMNMKSFPPLLFF
jgi:hypothetical protein